MSSKNVEIIPAKKKVVENIDNKINLKEKVKVAAYCRVSKNSEGLERSLDTQITYFKSIIKENENWEFKGIYFDDGISGTGIEKRTQFKEMVNEAIKGNINLILTKSVTRFARNTVDLLDTVRKLKDANVEVRFEKENISTFSKDGELLLTILAAFAQAEAESISQNVKWGKQKASEKGKDQFHPIFGYDYKDGEYIINEKEGLIVKEIFDRFISGETYKEIADSLKDRGIKTRKNNLFNYPQVKVILKNEKYAGFTVLQKHFSSNPITHKVKLNLGDLPKYRINDTHPKIIDVSDFNKVQKRIKELSRIHQHPGCNVYEVEEYKIA